MSFDNRKRQRACDDGCEFMPISKRMNNLHIRSGQENLPEPHSIQSNCYTESCKDTESQDSSSAKLKSQDNSVCVSGSLRYNPDLDVLQNPHYYQINRILFEAYIQRVQRHSSTE